MDNKRSRDADIEAASASGKRMRLDRAASPVGSNDIISVAHEALFRSHGNDNNARKRKNNFTTIESILATPPDTGPTYDDENDNATGNDNYGTANAQTSEYDGAFSGQNSNDASTANNGSNNSYPPIDRAPPGVLIEITRSFQQAVSTGRHRRSPTYVDADVMIVYWEEDYEEVKSSTKLLGSVFQHSFYYATEVFAIPSINPEQALYIAVEEFFAKNSTPEKLAILYYAGRSAPSEPSGGPPLWMPRREDSELSIRYKPIESAYRKSLCDVLLLLDQCNIRHPYYTRKINGTARRKVVEVVDAPPAEPGKVQISFAKALAEELVAIAHGEPLSVETLHRQILGRMAVPKPRGRGRPPKEPTMKTVAEQQHLPNHYFLQECRSIVLAPIPDVPQVVLCIRVLNGSEDISRWGQWIHDADLKARNSVQFEGLYSGFSTMIVLRVPVDEWDYFPDCPVGSLVGYTTIGDIDPDVLESIDANLTAKLWVDDSPPLLAVPSDPNGAAINHGPAVSALSIASISETASSSAQGDMSLKRPRKALPTERRLLPSGPGSFSSPSRTIEQATGSRDRPVYRQPLDQQQQQQQQEQQRLSQQGLSRQLVESGLSEKDALLVAAAQKPFKISIKLAGQNHMCNECKAGFKDIESLRNHVRKQHTRPFHCVFNWAGCESTFASKNEWKRHVMSQHILLHFWVCQNELCSKMVTKAPAAHDSFSMPDGAIFNRKDLFTQHLRRMHTPAHVKKLMKQAKNANKPPNHPAILEWENKMKELQQAGIKPRCRLPDFMSCPSPGCGVDFHGSNAWDDRMEHVARHLEGAAAGRETLVTFGRKSDPTLTDWATRPEVGIAKRIGPNAWCLDNPLRPEILEWTGDDDDDADGPPIIRKIDPRGPRLPFEEYNEKEDEEHPEDEASPPSDTHPADDRSSREGSRSVIEVADPDSPIADDYSDSDPEKSGDREEATSSGQTAEGKQPAKDKDHFEEDTATRREPTPETRQSPREESSPSIVVSQ